MPIVNLSQILTFAAEKGASDIHFQVGAPPLLRHHGELFPLKHAPLSEEDMVAIGQTLAKYADAEKFKQELRDYDGSFALANVARFRVNVFRQNGRYAAVLRLIPFKPRTFQELNLPKVLEKIASLKRGLILVTGATGNGKSTTLAAIINHINQKRRAHIITIEDPIEYLFEKNLSVVSQREIGPDTESFASALRAAMRQDPDVLMVGELRDHQTIDTCLKAAETGHLVMASIHTADVLRTVNRLLSYFPAEEQPAVRQRLAENLVAIVSQQLLPSVDKSGLVPACEILLANKTIEMCLKNPEKTNEILAHVAKNRDLGMQTFDQHLIELVKARKISMDDAMLAAEQAEQLERDMTLEE
ncbi:MAG TPA: PilT/PilU family type 4a pilus ATPase [Candidatus Aminicenantes bacterium]|nr:PilT/PilU family type 4a pilus ATPase [Candidatus Aminicenantes bacterium]